MRLVPGLNAGAGEIAATGSFATAELSAGISKRLGQIAKARGRLPYPRAYPPAPDHWVVEFSDATVFVPVRPNCLDHLLDRDVTTAIRH
jgi:hypothetical protein